MKENASGRGYLFICCTPLQGIIARRIIEAEGLDKDLCHVFFYTSFDNEIYRNYYNQVRKLCSTGFYYVWKPNFPAYIKDSKSYFSSISYHSCWFASIDSIFVQLSLGRGGKDIYTFDDGAANVVSESHYYRNEKVLNYKKWIFWLLGNRYSRDRIKDESIRHYTIFPGQKNITDNIKSVDLFLEEERCQSLGECVVVLGTVLRELCPSSEEVERVHTSLQGYIDRICEDVFYIPHPREGDVSIKNVEILRERCVAEDIVCRLLEKYNRIYLAGFGSTAQLTLAGIKEVKSCFFCWEGEPVTVKEVRKLAGELSINSPKEVVLF
ncbi:hypothetical protein MARI_04500 [Marinobacter sp. JH2]|nr:glycosyltransferase family 52 [Marinobacter sp. JH2]QBM16370.1 hypothetical protein MARI_04500 [Marinobacter sp. JH2]